MTMARDAISPSYQCGSGGGAADEDVDRTRDRRVGGRVGHPLPLEAALQSFDDAPQGEVGRGSGSGHADPSRMETAHGLRVNPPSRGFIPRDTARLRGVAAETSWISPA